MSLQMGLRTRVACATVLIVLSIRFIPKDQMEEKGYAYLLDYVIRGLS